VDITAHIGGHYNKFTEERVYVACLSGKMHKAVFDIRKVWRATTVFELMHIEICGL
jgi:hypothetical protein